MSRVADLQDGRASAAMRLRVSRAIRNGLATVEKYHKRYLFLRSSGGIGTDPMRITSRAGNLSRSYRIYMRAGALEGAYGSELKRAPILEDGATISIRNKRWLTIPTENARIGVGLTGRAADFPGLFRPRGPGGVPRQYLARNENDRLVVYFWLKKSVTIPARPTLQIAANTKRPEIERSIADAAASALAAEAEPKHGA